MRNATLVGFSSLALLFASGVAAADPVLGPEVVIDATPGHARDGVVLASNGSVYLAVWADHRLPTSNVYGSLRDLSGASIGAVFILGTGENPATASDGA